MGKCLFMRKGETHTAPKVGLPSGYIELKYIESSGTQYIDTGIVPNQDTRAVIDFQSNAASGMGIFGARQSAASQAFTFGSSSGSGSWYVGYNNYGTAVDASLDTIRHTADFDKNKVYLDGNLIQTFTYDNFTAYGSAFLLAYNQAGTVYFQANAKLYSCRIYDNGTLVRDYVPCATDGGEIGLYDIVNEVFYGNAGSGTFTGSEVA